MTDPFSSPFSSLGLGHGIHRGRRGHRFLDSAGPTRAADPGLSPTLGESFETGHETFVADGVTSGVRGEIFVGGGEIFVDGGEILDSDGEIFVGGGEAFGKSDERFVASDEIFAGNGESFAACATPTTIGRPRTVD